MRANLAPAIAVAIMCFALYRWAYLRSKRTYVRAMLVAASVVIMIPSLLFASNYVLWIPYAPWFYRFHALPDVEILSGLAMGLLGIMFASSKLRPAKLNVPILTVCAAGAAALVIAPFAKQIFYSLDYSKLEDKWCDGVCLQTSGCTCVPACAATVIRMLGEKVTEKELAREAGTILTGTEYWYLERALNRRGYKPHLTHLKSIRQAPIPSIVGVKIGETGHVVVLFRKDKKGAEIGEPMRGRRYYTWEMIRDCYKPDGMCITISNTSKRGRPEQNPSPG